MDSKVRTRGAVCDAARNGADHDLAAISAGIRLQARLHLQFSRENRQQNIVIKLQSHRRVAPYGSRLRNAIHQVKTASSEGA